MGLFDKIKKAIDDSGLVDATKEAVSNIKETIESMATSSNSASKDSEFDEISFRESVKDKEWECTDEIYREYSKLLEVSDRTEFLQKKVYPYKTFQRLSAIQPLITDSILIFGINNRFLNFVTKLNIEMTDKSYLYKMTYIYRAFKIHMIDVDSKLLLNPTLYNGRDEEEFEYTLNCFFLLPRTAGEYLKDTSVVDVMMFVNGDDLAKSEIKPAGIKGEEGDTIYRVIEEWSKDNEINRNNS